MKYEGVYAKNTMLTKVYWHAQDPKSKNWLIVIGKVIGYYPASLFSNMTSANQVGWIGKTTNDLNTPSPPMGSGALPNGVLGHAAYFKYPTFTNEKIQGLETGMGQIQSSNSGCYNASYYNDSLGLLYIQFGGPGGKCNGI